MGTINTEQLISFLLSQQKEEKTIELNIAYKLFMQHLKLNNRPGTIDAYTECLKPVFIYFEKMNITKSHQITTSVINSFIIERKPKVKNNTINKEIVSLRTMLNLMIKYQYIDKVNFEFKRLKVEKPIIDKIDSSDISKILKYFPTSKVEDKYKLIFLLMLTTGIRTSEVLNIKNSNINIDKKRILLDFTKTHKPRYIYIIDELIELVSKVRNKNTYLFNDHTGNQLTDNALRCFFKHLKKDLKIETLSPHKLRHYYATSLYNKSLDIYLVSNLLGHTNIQTTQIYLDIDNKDNQIKNEYYNPLKDLLTV